MIFKGQAPVWWPSGAARSVTRLQGFMSAGRGGDRQAWLPPVLVWRILQVVAPGPLRGAGLLFNGVFTRLLPVIENPKTTVKE